MKAPQNSRRLAAIMFTDIVGYTAIMQQDEQEALKIRNRHRAVFTAAHQEHNGEIVQYFGDGTLSLFQSGIEAVNCAIAIQKHLQQIPQVPLRIGVHIGDIVFDGTDIYGDSVNVASRIESMSEPGAVLISDKLNNELKNQPQIKTLSLGKYTFKNVEEPVQLFAVQDKELHVPAIGSISGKGMPYRKSIAVLPFVNRSARQENEYFSDGISEEIINALSKINGLQVTSRSSSFFFKGKQVSIKEIGQQLNVSTIVEGSVRLSGNKMRITAHLVDVKNDVQFWSESFDRSIEDVFAVQDEISLLIADQLRENLGHFELEDQLRTAPPVPVNAYKSYLQGRFHILKMTPEEIKKGMAILQDLVLEQPNYALAYIGIHLGFTLLGTMGYRPAVETFIEGQPYLEKAIALEEDLPECQLNLAYMAFLQEWNTEKALSHVHRSGEIRKTVEYYQSMASILVADSKFKAALNYIDTAIKIDPFSGINYHLKGFILYAKKQYDQAIHYFSESQKLNPLFMSATLYQGMAMINSGEASAALKMFQALPGEDEDLMRLGGTTMAYAGQGNVEAAEEGIRQLKLELEAGKTERAIMLLINSYTLLGRQEKAIDFIRKGIEFRLPLLVYLAVEPIMDRLKDHPDYSSILQDILGTRKHRSQKPRKYKKALFTPTSLQQAREQLKNLMQEQQTYLDPTLTLRSLAEQLDLSANQLSQLLNEGFDKNFAEYINGYRIKAFKKNAADPAKAHLTILALAYESGFNSKTVFNTFFKKETGMTPSQYWKKLH